MRRIHLRNGPGVVLRSLPGGFSRTARHGTVQAEDEDGGTEGDAISAVWLASILFQMS